jgi:hypothetical protein
MKISESQYVSVARDAAARAGINPDLFVKQIQLESSFNPHAEGRERSPLSCSKRFLSS